MHGDHAVCRLRTMLRTMQSADCILSPMQSADCAGSQIACNKYSENKFPMKISHPTVVMDKQYQPILTTTWCNIACKQAYLREDLFETHPLSVTSPED